jgi:hypothetical protein
MDFFLDTYFHICYWDWLDTGLRLQLTFPISTKAIKYGASMTNPSVAFLSFPRGMTRKRGRTKQFLAFWCEINRKPKEEDRTRSQDENQNIEKKRKRDESPGAGMRQKGSWACRFVCLYACLRHVRLPEGRNLSIDSDSQGNRRRRVQYLTYLVELQRGAGRGKADSAPTAAETAIATATAARTRAATRSSRCRRWRRREQQKRENPRDKIRTRIRTYVRTYDPFHTVHTLIRHTYVHMQMHVYVRSDGMLVPQNM